MANPFDGDKRYVEITFEPGKWNSSIGAGGVVTWTPKPGMTPDVSVKLVNNEIQTHNDCGGASSVTTTNGTAVIHIV